MQSDVLECAEDMRDKFEAAGGAAFQLAHPHGQPGSIFQASSSSSSNRSSSSSSGHASGSSEISSAVPASTSGSGGPAGAGSASAEGEEAFASAWAVGGWLVENPVGVPTEREVHTLQQGLPVFRVLVERTEEPAPAS